MVETDMIFWGHFFISNPLPNNPIWRRVALKAGKTMGPKRAATLSSLGVIRRLWSARFVSFKLRCGLLPPGWCKTVDLGSRAFRWDLQPTNEGRARRHAKDFCFSRSFATGFGIFGRWFPSMAAFLLRHQGVCIMTTAFLHFFFLASFCWVLTEAWQSYMAVTGKVRTRLIRKRFLCLGWGE